VAGDREKAAMSIDKTKSGGDPAKGLQPAASKDQPKPPRKPEPRKAEPGERRTFSQGVSDYFRSLKFEWLKLTFPTRKELVQSTIVVFLFTTILMIAISLFDLIMSLLFNKYIIPPA
jgi:preprotein translocase subunit SecE